jgi:hypothetical protein
MATTTRKTRTPARKAPKTATKKDNQRPLPPAEAPDCGHAPSREGAEHRESQGREAPDAGYARSGGWDDGFTRGRSQS